MKHLLVLIIPIFLSACQLSPVNAPVQESTELETQANFWSQYPIADVTPSNEAYAGSIATKADGNSVLALVEKSTGLGGFSDVYVRSWNPYDAAWSSYGTTPADVNPARQATNPVVATFGNTVFVAFNEYSNNNDIYVRKWNGSSWENVAGAADLDPAHPVFAPSLTLTGGGEPVVAFSEFVDGKAQLVVRWGMYNYRYRRYIWSTLDGLMNLVPATDYSNPQIKYYNGQFFVSFEALSGSPATRSVYVAAWNNGWRLLGGAQCSSPCNSALRGAQLAINDAGKLIVSYLSNNDIFVNSWNGSSWNQLGSSVDGSLSTTLPYALGIDPAGRAVLSFSAQQKGSLRLYVKRWNPATSTWASIGGAQNRNLNNLAYPRAISFANSQPLIIWDEKGTSSDVFVNQFKVNDWELFGKTIPTNDISATDLEIRNNTPFIALASRTTASPPLNYVTVQNWDGQNWRPLGANVFASSNSTILSLDLATDSAAKPYVAFVEGDPSSQRLRVRRQIGTSVWEHLGEAITSAAASTPPALQLNSSDQPLIAYVQNQSSNDTNLYVKQWNGSSWQALGGQLERVGVSVVSQPAMTLISQQIPVVAWDEWLSAEGHHVYVRRWNPSSQTWQNMRAALELDSSNYHFIKLALNSAGQPVIAWTDNSFSATTPGKIYVKEWTGTSWQAIGTPITLATQDYASWLYLSMDSTGKPVLGWTKQAISAGPLLSQVVRWTGSTWQTVGQSLTVRSASPLALDSADRPYLLINPNTSSLELRRY